MIVQKGNRQLRVSEAEKDRYLADGYEVLDEQGKVLERPGQKTYSAAEVERLKAGYEAKIAKLERALKKESKE